MKPLRNYILNVYVSKYFHYFRYLSANSSLWCLTLSDPTRPSQIKLYTDSR